MPASTSLNSFGSTNQPNSRPLPSSRDLLALFTQLEASLRASQSALLVRNLPRFEELTEEQARLSDQLSPMSIPVGDSWRKRASDHGDPVLDLELVLAARDRILYLVRVQRVLLERARHSLRILGNFITASHGIYAPLPETTGIGLSASGEE